MRIAFLVADNYVLDTAGPFAGADIDPASLDFAFGGIVGLELIVS